MRTLSKAMLVATVLALTACGGGASTTGAGPTPTAECNPADPNTHGACGTVLLALTDADGDFLNYTVDVVSLRLETANGRVIETLPRRARINFTDYVDLSELVTVATVPPATYVAGTIRLDYSNAEVFVEANGAPKAAVVLDAAGVPLAQTELRIQLANRDQLLVTRGQSALLQLDFDLAASHSVDIGPTPAEAVAEPFILAEVTPVDAKDLRVRGPLVAVSVDDMSYTVAVRPFHLHDGDFGQVSVNVNSDTEFEIDDALYTGADGLQALQAAGAGTPTVAAGTLDVAERRFTARIVLAGSSVPGIELDAVLGNVISRDGNFLTVRGATILQADRPAHFHDDVVVEVGPDTLVFRDGHRRRDLGIDAISIGQRVTIRGTQATATTAADAPQILFDATQGAVRMHVTQLAGIVNSAMPGQADITLHAIDRRRVEVFDFTGTGQSREVDADPANYEIMTGNLLLADFAAGQPIVARGFPNAFGVAPPDFFGRTVIDYTGVASALGIGWGMAGTTAPFAGMSADGLILDNANPDIELRHYVKQGPVLIDLTSLGSDTSIVPRISDRSAFYIKTVDSLRMYTEFGDFVNDLANSLDGVTSACSLHAHGQYDADANVFTAHKLGIYLVEPQ